MSSKKSEPTLVGGITESILIFQHPQMNPSIMLRKVKCPYCNHMFSAEDEDCKNCGKPKPVKTMDPELVQHIARTTGVILYGTHQDKKLDGINGWLWFWCFTNTILAPVVFLVGFLGWRTEIISDAGFIVLILGLCRMLLSVIAGYKVWTKTHDAKYFVYAYYVFEVLLYGILFFIVLYATVVGNFTYENIFALGFAVFISLVWIGYFRFSKRVLQTFGENFFRFQ